VAERAVIPELIQGQMTGERLAAEASRLLRDAASRDRMRRDLAEVALRLTSSGDAMHKAGAVIQELIEGKVAHVS
jgi:lipid-A-disaccharide synthase